MDILITGGNGLLGRHVVSALQERGDTVRVLALPGEEASWLEDRGVEVHRGDIRHAETPVHLAATSYRTPRPPAARPVLAVGR